MNTLIFFDINGTLIKRDERTDIPFSNAVNLLLDCDDAMKGIDTSARSDKDVFIEVLTNQNLTFDEKKWEDFLGLYINQLNLFYKTDVWRENADATTFVKKLYDKKYILALISGELSIGAEYKLKKIGIWDYFLTGGFGEDGLKRYDIADMALAKVKDQISAQFDEIYVIGDTVLDIKTAKHLGAKSIAITTGSHSRDTLLKNNPDYCINTFEEIESLFL